MERRKWPGLQFVLAIDSSCVILFIVLKATVTQQIHSSAEML